MTKLSALKAQLEQVEPQLKKLNALPERITHFSISRFAHYELVMSNWLAYFLSSNGAHELSPLFGKALMECITPSNNQQTAWLDDKVSVIQEFRTQKGFLDLLLYDEKINHKTFGNALLIEHKINANLYNDLNDYYKSVSADKKKAIVLSAQHLDIPHSAFQLVTYRSLLKALEKHKKNYIDKADHRHQVYLDDFMGNLENLSDNMSKEHLSFYLNNSEPINELLKARKKAQKEFDSLVIDALKESKWEPKINSGDTITIELPKKNIVVYLHMPHANKAQKIKYEFWIKDALAAAYSEKIHTEIGSMFGTGFAFKKHKESDKWFLVATVSVACTSEINQLDREIKNLFTSENSSLFKLVTAILERITSTP